MKIYALTYTKIIMALELKKPQYNYRLLVNTAHQESILSAVQIFVRDSSIKTTKNRMQSIGWQGRTNSYRTVKT